MRTLIASALLVSVACAASIGVYPPRPDIVEVPGVVPGPTLPVFPPMQQQQQGGQYPQQQQQQGGGQCANQQSDQQCCQWAQSGECDANPYWMKVSCARACGSCGATVANAAQVPTNVDPSCSQQSFSQGNNQGGQQTQQGGSYGPPAPPPAGSGQGAAVDKTTKAPIEEEKVEEVAPEEAEEVAPEEEVEPEEEAVEPEEEAEPVEETKPEEVAPEEEPEEAVAPEEEEVAEPEEAEEAAPEEGPIASDYPQFPQNTGGYGTQQGAGATPQCGQMNSHELCNFWADAGECTNNAIWMLPNCPLSCPQQCGGGSNFQQQPQQQGYGQPQQSFQPQQPQYGNSLGSGSSYGQQPQPMQPQQSQYGQGAQPQPIPPQQSQYGAQQPSTGCLNQQQQQQPASSYGQQGVGMTSLQGDTHELCAFWASAGECSNNALWMRPNCAGSCSGQGAGQLPPMNNNNGNASAC